MRTFFNLRSFLKAGVSLALSLFTINEAEAVITVTTSDGTDGACVGSVVQVNASGTNGHLLQYQYREDGGDWKNMGSPTRATVTILENMPNSKVYFRIIDKENAENSSDSDGVEVKLRTDGCPEACITSASGDYIHGTDFDLKNGSGTQKPNIPDGIVSYFDKGNSKVDFKKKDSESYVVTNNMASVFPNGIKPKNNTSNNYYYVYDGGVTHSEPFIYTFNYWTWHDKPYTFKMVFYMYFPSTCTPDGNLSIKLEGPQGSYGYQQADIKTYYDQTDVLISRVQTSGTSFGIAKPFENIDRSKISGNMIRVEATYYGVFPHTGSSNDQGGPWNGNKDFQMYPLFQQFPSCAKIAIDYISAELPSVCIANNSVCKGKSIAVNAAGFPEDVVSGNKFKWFQKINGNWQEMTADTIKGHQSVKIPVDYFGKREYKIEGTTNNQYVPNKTIEVYFELGGKDCDPTKPDGIDGAEKVCYDKEASPAQQTTYSVHSQDTDERVFYKWTLTNNDDNSTYAIGADATLAERGEVLSNATTSLRMTDINVAYPKAGNYTLTLEVYKQTGNDGKYDKVTNVDYTKSVNITVYEKPTASFHVDGSANDKICPFTENKLVVADITDASKYNFTWTGASGSLTEPGSATIAVPAEPCLLKNNTYGVTLGVAWKVMPTCATTLTKNLATDFSTPALLCDELKSAVGVDAFGVKEYPVPANSKKLKVTFPKPALDASASCNPNPNITITVTGVDVENNPVSHTIIKKYNEMTATNTTLSLPVSAGATGTDKQYNGYTVTYTVSNGCGGVGDVSEPCTYKIILRYSAVPNIDCTPLTLKALTTYLSAYNPSFDVDADIVCYATPGEGSNVGDKKALPKISTQEFLLEDKNFRGTYIKGVAISRSPISAYTGVDAPYTVGVHSVTWQFTNFAGNTATCTQTITVIDDTKPVVKCTSTGTEVSVNNDPGLCSAVSANVMSQVVAKMKGGVAPSASAACGGNPIVGSVWYKVKTSTAWAAWKDGVAFNKGEHYTLRWSFKKTAADYVTADSAYCDQDFTVVDNEAPVVDCGGASAFVVTVNYKTQGGYIYDCASGTGKTGIAAVNTVYTLSDILKNLPSVTDNCGNVTLTVAIDSATSYHHEITGSNVDILAALYKFEFKQFTTSKVTYTFIDGSNNVSECVKNITVIDRSVPNPVCFSPQELIFNADDDCKYVYEGVTLSEILSHHMASMTFNRYVYNNKYDIRSNAYNAVLDQLNSREIEYPGEVAPSSIVREHFILDENGEWVKDVADVIGYAKPGLHSEGGSYKICKIQTDKYEGGPKNGQEVNTKYRLVATQKLSATPPDEYRLVNENQVLNTTFDLGKTVFTIYYSNGDLYENGVWKEAGDSTPCTVTIIVEDKTKPTVKCGPYAVTKSVDLPNDDKCDLSFTDSGLLELKKASDVNASDNCSQDDEDFTITYERLFEGKSVALKDPFPIGTTTLNWYIADASGNKAVCHNEITVNDVTAPYTCEKLGLTKIDVDADENCEAAPSKVFPLGFNPPVVPNDNCSPVTDKSKLDKDGNILGVGKRDDGKGIFDDYYKAVTIITWTFADAAGNSISCPQEVHVNDNTEPEVVCEPKNINYTLKADECEASTSQITLVPPTAKDNCSGTDLTVSHTRQYIYHSGKKDKVIKDTDPAINDAYKIGTTEIVWTFADKAATPNIATCVQYVNVFDKNAPDFKCPGTVDVDAPLNECEATLSFDPLPDSLKRFDECDNAFITPTFVSRSDGETDIAAPYKVGLTTITWSYKDSSNNEKLCEQVISVKDITKPVVHCITPAVVHDDSTGAGSCVLSPATLIDHMVKKNLVPSATDACQPGKAPTMIGERWYLGLDSKGTPVRVEKGGKPVLWNENTVPYEPGYYIIKFIFTDDYGNSDYCEQEVYIKDSNKPVIECSDFAPSKPIYPAVNECSVEIVLNDLGADGFATEYCSPTEHIDGDPYIYDGDVINGSIDNLIPFAPTVKQSGENLIVVWKFTSHHGVDEFCPQIISVVDNQKPTCVSSTVTINTADAPVGTACDEFSTAIDLSAIGATDNCGTISKYEYRVVDSAVPEDPDAEVVYTEALGSSITVSNMSIRDYYVYWRLTDGQHVVNDEACVTTIHINDNVPLQDVCANIDKDQTIKVDDCGPKNMNELDATATDVCFGTIHGVPTVDGVEGREQLKKLQLGDHTIIWKFWNHEHTVSDQCTQNLHIVTTKPIVTECPTGDDAIHKLELTGGKCTESYTLVQRIAKHPCTDATLYGTPYVFGEKVDPANYEQDFPAGEWEIVWKFKDETHTLDVPEAECSEWVKVGDNNKPLLPCVNEPAEDKIIDDCEVDAAEINFKNKPEINVADICNPGTVVPNIWIVGDENTENNPVHTPADLTKDPNPKFKPGKYTIKWEYIFHPSGKGELKAYCTQTLDIKTTKELVVDCKDAAFAKIEKDANDKCLFPAADIEFTPLDAVNPCDPTAIAHPQAYIGTTKIVNNVFTAPFEQGTTTITWKYVDETGTLVVNTAECTQDVIITDNTKPTIKCHDDIEYFLKRNEATGVQIECTAAPADIKLKRPAVSDNCTADSLDFKYWLKREFNGVVEDSLAPYLPGLHNITWTVKDLAGNAETCNMKVVVRDTVSPKINCPDDLLDIKAKEHSCKAELPDVSPVKYSVKDVCGDFVIVPVGTRSDGLDIADPYPVGTTTITWVYADSVNSLLPVDDPNRHVYVCTQVIKVADTTKPILDCANTSERIDKQVALGECQIEASDVYSDITLPTAIDECQTDAPVMTSNRWYFGREGDSIPTRQLTADKKDINWNDDVPFRAGYYEIHFIFTDNYGNADSCIQKIFVKDINPPYLNNCKDVKDQILNPELDECEAAIVPTELNTYEGKEVCTGVAIPGVPHLLIKNDDETFTLSTNPIPATVKSGDSIYIRWVYTTQMGISDVCDQKIKVVDNQKPKVDCEAIDKVITLTADPEQCEISGANANIVAPVVDDNCGSITGRGVRFDFDHEKKVWVKSDKLITDAYPTGTTLIKWFFEDTNVENTDSCDQYVFVKGIVAPKVDCDTIKDLFDSIPECVISAQTVKVPVPMAFDSCSNVMVPGVGVRSDGKSIDDLYPLGITHITWTFTDTTNSVSSTCEQDYHLVTKLPMIKFCPEDTVKAVLVEGACTVDVPIDPQEAEHPCTGEKIPGLAYLNGSDVPLTDLNLQLIGGKHQVMWIFTDNTNTLAKPIDTCYVNIDVEDKNPTPVPCVNDDIKITLEDDCTIDATNVDLKNTGVEVPEICVDGKTVKPSIWRTSWDRDVVAHVAVDHPDKLGIFNVGKDTVIWTYVFNPSNLGNKIQMQCKQEVWVKDSLTLKANCVPEDSITTLNAGKECEIAMDAVLEEIGTPEATDRCIDKPVKGVPSLTDGSNLPASIKVGDTIIIKWMFTDELYNADTVYCEQKVTAVTDLPPVFTKCDSVKATLLTYVTEGECEYEFKDADFKAPVANDACTDKEYAAVGYFKSNDAPVIGAKLGVGRDTIVWVFSSPTSTATDTCEQPIRVLDSLILEVKCLPEDSITTLNAGKSCEIAMDAVLEQLGSPKAYDKCVDDSIPGVAFLDKKGTPLPDKIKVGDTITVVWRFNDPEMNADTLFCEQKVTAVTDLPPVFTKCDSVNATLLTYVTEGECEYEFKDADFKAPVANDACTDKEYAAVGYFKSNDAPVIGAKLGVGRDTIVWVFSSPTSTATDTCEQPIRVLDSLILVVKCLPEDSITTLNAGKECEIAMDAVLEQLGSPKAYDKCVDDSIPGVAFLDKKGTPLPDKIKVGDTITVVWRFNDPEMNADTLFCEQKVTAVTDLPPVFDKCDSVKAEVIEFLAKGTCDYTTVEGDFKAPIAKDACTGIEYPAAGYIKSTGDTIIGAKLSVGVDTVVWVFSSPTSTATDTCEQPIRVRTDINPDFTCDTMKLVVGEVKGECFLPLEEIEKLLGAPYALEHCTQTKVPGVATLVDGSPLPEKFAVGDTITVRWTFEMPELTTGVTICDQKVTVNGDAAPKFECSSLDTLKFTAVGECSVDLKPVDIPVPMAKDGCKDGEPTIAGVGSRADGNDFYGLYNVGFTEITWTFTSPTSSENKVCTQIIWVRDSLMISADCLPDDSITILNSGQTCEIAMDAVLSQLGTPIAKDACIDTLKIPGVALSEDGSPLPETLKVGDTIKVKWMFHDDRYNADTIYCYQKVTAITDLPPVFEKCDSVNAELLTFVAEGKCEYEFGENDFKAPIGKDACTGKEYPAVGYFKSNNKPVIGTTLHVGADTIVWVFSSPTSTTTTICEQPINVKTTNKIDGECTEENYPKLDFVVNNENCTVPAEGVVAKLTPHKTTNPCNENIVIEGVPSRLDGLSMDEPFGIGITTIVWTFTDTTHTLVDTFSTCQQIVNVVDQNDPKVDCPTAFPDTVLYLDAENCAFDLSAIPVHLDAVPANPCNGEVATVDTVRSSGAAMNAPYGVGVETITWTFTFQQTNRSVQCPQRIEVIDTIAPIFDCSQLKDTILVEITTSGTSVTFDEVKEAGFFIPEVTDICTDVNTDVTRDDSKELDADYDLGNTTITFKFSDIYNNNKFCSQVVSVVDMIPPTVECPELSLPIACISDTVPAYSTYAEFKRAGGSISDEARVDLSTFRHEDIVEGDECSALVTRNYMFTTLRNIVVQCTAPQYFSVHDTLAPIYKGIPSTNFEAVTSCDVADTVPPVVVVEDNCDPNPMLKVERVSYQSNDPADCHYYTYDVVYTFTAYDRCGNYADPVVYTVHVVDTVAPHVNEPEDWKDELHPIYRGNCDFEVPDITGLIPSDSIYQNCGDNAYLTFRQEPAAGTPVKASIDIKLIISDVCGNDTVLTKHLLVQNRKDIVQIVHRDTVTVCADETALLNPRSPKVQNSLSSNMIRTVVGTVWAQDFDGTWWPVPTTALWDCYRDTMSDQTITYSNNRRTYAHLFSDATKTDSAGNAAYSRYNLLLRRTQSDNYIYVASDTVSGCSDTARVYVNVVEKPRLALASGEWNLCEGDSLALNGDFGSRFPVCVEDMGDTITAEGWMINDKVYHAADSVNYDNGILHTAVYFATNSCGTTTTLNSLAVSCDGSLSTAEDSVAFAGTPEKLELLKEDKLYTSDSVKVNVFTHYNPAQVLVTTMPQDRPRVWEGDPAQLIVTLPYDNPTVYKWMEVVGEFDGEKGAVYDKYGNIIANGSGEDDDNEIDYSIYEDSAHFVYKNRVTVMPTDSAYYYVIVGNGVCPSVSSNLVNIDVMHQLPTAITPYTRDGLNDDFMRGHRVVIFNRYGQLLFEGNNGWDGTYRGLLADPGVYFYEVVMKGGKIYKGSIEVVKVE